MVTRTIPRADSHGLHIVNGKVGGILDRQVPAGGISLMAPRPKLFYSDITKAKLVSFTHIGHVSCLSSMGCRVL